MRPQRVRRERPLDSGRVVVHKGKWEWGLPEWPEQGAEETCNRC